MGNFELASGDVREAQQHLIEAVKVAAKADFHANVLDALVSMAAARAKAGDAASALELVFLVVQDPATKHPSQTRAEELRAELTARLPPQQIEAAQARARSKPFEQTIEEILRWGSEQG